MNLRLRYLYLFYFFFLSDLYEMRSCESECRFFAFKNDVAQFGKFFTTISIVYRGFSDIQICQKFYKIIKILESISKKTPPNILKYFCSGTRPLVRRLFIKIEPDRE